MIIPFAVAQLVPDALYTQAETYEHLKRTWYDVRPLPTEAELAAAWEAYQHEQMKSEAAAARLQTIMAALDQSVTDVLMAELTTDQIKAIVALLLFKVNGLTIEGKVKPFAQWRR